MEALHQPGDIIAQRYRITGTLGQGGVGITYAAQDLKSGQQVALKALSVRQMGEWKVLELFEREARILEQLNHPAIPRYLDYFEVDTPEDRAFYIAQELAEGKSLVDLVEIGWRTNEDGVRRIATQILEILVYLHSLKPPVVHRDIKPQNLIWGKDGKIFLVDFGAVQDTYRTTLAKGSTIVGTYGYMAPEQFRGQAVPATDLYGLGATVLFLLTHRSPSDLPQERLKISFRSRIQVSEGFADWLEKMLEPDVEDRFPSAKEALAALQGRMVVAKTRSSVSWQALVGVGVAGLATITLLNSFKWAVLGPIGFQPSGICKAAKSGNIDVIRDYLNQGGDPTYATDAENDLPLLECLLHSGKKDIVELVIAKLPDVNAKDNKGRSPLHREGSKQKEVVELLIAKGADVNAKDNKGRSPLHMASSKEVVELLITKGADVNARDNEAKTPLHMASSKEVVELLIAKGADVNAQDKNGWTLLYRQAEQADRKEIAELLIAKGADVNARDNDGQTILKLALKRDDKKYLFAELLIAKGADVNAETPQTLDDCYTAFLKAGMVTMTIVDEFDECQAGVNVNQSQTLLHWAVEQHNIDAAEILITNGANINAKTAKGRTPLHSAALYYNWKDIAELLISKGAQVNAKNIYGRTPLHLAASKDMAELLIAKGADVNAKDNQGNTPLQLVISFDKGFYRDMIKLLVAKGADVNVKVVKGRTPLHLAALYNSKDVAELVIAKDGQLNAKNIYGRTPLHVAAKNNSKDVAELLLARGARVNDRDIEGKTPLQWATEGGYTHIVKLLKSHGGTK
jgi:ankyrin repeat protein